MKKILFLGTIAAVLLSGCQPLDVYKSIYQAIVDESSISDTPVNWELTSSLETFSPNEYEKFVEAYQDKFEKDYKSYQDSDGDFFGWSDDAAETSGSIADSVASQALEEAPSQPGDSVGLGGAVDEQITNVQEQGVDEGDIVKAHGDYLIVLSRGRVFSVRVKENDIDLLKPVFKGKAYAEGFTDGTWYDELLVSDDTIVVIGYSYAVEATQVGLFAFNNGDGSITHRQTFFIDSNDYYSSRNYASRLVDGQLIFYMPYYLFPNSYYYSDEPRPEPQRPQIKYWKEGNTLTAGQDLLDITDLYKPVQTSDEPTLHTVLTCDVSLVGDTVDSSADAGQDTDAGQGEIDCSGQAVVGPYSRNFYVSPTAVYLWVSDSYSSYYYDETAADDNDAEIEETPDAYVYAMPLDGSGVGVVAAYGTPLDQFSFKESDDGYLNVLVQRSGFGDVMFAPEFSASELALVRFPLTQFRNEAELLDPQYYHSLPEPDGYWRQNRFVGDYFLYGSTVDEYYYDDWYTDEPTAAAETASRSKPENKMFVLNYKQDSDVQEVKLEHGVERIEVLDNENAVVVGNSGDDLMFTWAALDDADTSIVDTYTVNDASQGETRSHGFFYSSAQNMLGLPLRTPDEWTYDYLWDESIEVLFLSLEGDKFTGLGSLTGGEGSKEFDDKCKFSCMDWYGNSRPIFYQNRIFALMGFDLVEGVREGDTMIEQQRVNIFRDVPVSQ